MGGDQYECNFMLTIIYFQVCMNIVYFEISVYISPTPTLQTHNKLQYLGSVISVKSMYVLWDLKSHKSYYQWLLAYHYGQPPSTLGLSNIGLGLNLDG